MYISPFICGVLATLLAEVGTLLIASAVKAYKKKGGQP